MDRICVIALLLRLSCSVASGDSLGSVKCDPTSACPNSTTCCQGQFQDWHCCPIPNGVCCNDGLHCCPQGRTCSQFSLTCIGNSRDERHAGETPSDSSVLEEIKLQPAEMIDPQESSLVESYPATPLKTFPPNMPCPGTETPCPSPSGWHCCPFPMGSCCLGGMKCCRRGSTCFRNQCRSVAKDPVYTHVSTVNGDMAKPVVTLLHNGGSTEEDLKVNNVQESRRTTLGSAIGQKQETSDHESCPPGDMPCLGSAGWTCCPHGTVCIMNQCYPVSRKPTATIYRHPGKEVMSKAGIVTPCSCQSNQTCCLTETGNWGCCPSPNAVCCTDGTHCCPQGYQCGPQKCIPNTASLPWMTLMKDVKPEGYNRVQRDRSHHCQASQTCCKMATGSVGCCPHPNASCCADGVHCCPLGYTCDPTINKCKTETKIVPWLNKISAFIQSSQLAKYKLLYKPSYAP